MLGRHDVALAQRQRFAVGLWACTPWATTAPAASATGTGPNLTGRRPRFSARVGFLRSAPTTSPSTETAISAGLTAPMSRPIGAWMRAIAVLGDGLQPAAARRRAAWVFREPSAPT